MRRVSDASLGTLDRIRPLLLIVAIFAGLAYGAFLPNLVEDWFEALVYVSLIVLVFSLVLGAQFGDVLHSLRNVRFFSVAWFMNFVIVPFLAFALALIFLGPYPAIFVGFILYSIAPCTDWFLIFTSMANGDVPLGLALLPTNLILQVVLIPVYLFLFAGLIVPIQVDALVETFLVFIILPFALAGIARWSMKKARSEEWRNEVLGRSLPNLQVLTLVVIIFFMFAAQTDVILENIGPLSIIFIPTAILFFVTFSLVQLVSRGMKFKYGECALLSCTTIARNSPIGLAIAVGLFPDQPLIQAAIIIPEVIELPVLLLVVRILNAIRAKHYCHSPDGAA
jgi:ACR3 family arsenite efflux pump ArsB